MTFSTDYFAGFFEGIALGIALMIAAGALAGRIHNKRYHVEDDIEFKRTMLHDPVKHVTTTQSAAEDAARPHGRTSKAHVTQRRSRKKS